MPPIFPDLPRPLLFAHRGASRHAPENSLAAFELAVRSGADVLELDVHQSSDGEVVVIHDAKLERTTDGSGAVAAHSFAELNRLDAGCRFVSDSGAAVFAGKGIRIPRLAEVFAAFAGSDCAFNIEIKQREPSIIGATLDLLAQVGPARVVLAAADDVIMEELEAAQPAVPLGMSIGQCFAALRGAYIGGVPAHFAGRAMQIPPWAKGFIPVATGRLLRAARAAGVEVHLWTIDDPRQASRWLARGVDGIMSNDPGALAGLFADLRAG